MFSLVSLLAAMTVVSLQCGVQARPRIDNKIDFDNNLHPNVIPTPKRLKQFVHISSPPPTDARLIPGSPLELTCEAFGSPAPSIHWLKNGEILLDYEEDSNEVLSNEASQLAMVTSLLVVTSANDGDVFTCVATSVVNQETASTAVYTAPGDDLEVEMTLQRLLHPSPPLITLHYSDVFHNMGSDLVLPCRVYSLTPSQVYWLDNEKAVVKSHDRRMVLPSGDLLIRDLRFSDMGNYTCTAENQYGQTTIQTFVYALKG